MYSENLKYDICVFFCDTFLLPCVAMLRLKYRLGIELGFIWVKCHTHVCFSYHTNDS